MLHVALSKMRINVLLYFIKGYNTKRNHRAKELFQKPAHTSSFNMQSNSKKYRLLLFLLYKQVRA